MDFNKIKAQLKKISRTVDMIEADGQVTRLEKDLLRDYVKKLYELTLSDEVIMSTPSTVVEKPTAPPPPPPTPKPENKESVKVSATQNGSAKVESPEPVVEKKSAPESNVQTDVAIEESDGVPAEVLELFEEEEATELSEKLSKLAITDIEKSMSINEKIFTINELFNGNSQEFKSCLTKLNGISNYDEAVKYLSKEIATPYEWSEESKRKKAIKFIQLVNRKFK